MAEGQFDKDFGYLLPFLDKVAAAATSLSDAAAREELTRLMAEEKVRWPRIRQLLSGATGKPVAAPGNTPTPASVAPSPAVADEPAKPGFQFTVGSLRKLPR